MVDPVLRTQLATAAGADLGDSRKLSQQLLHFLVGLDVVDAVGLPGPVKGWNEEVSLNLREEPESLCQE